MVIQSFRDGYERCSRFLSKRDVPVLALILLSVLFVLLFPSKTFFLDDYHVIENNPTVQDLSFIPTHLKDFFNRSIFYVSLTLDHYFWGLEPHGYFLTNVVIHLFNAILIYYLSRFIFQRTTLSRKKHVYSFLCALLFLFHPIQLMTIRQIANRSILLSAFFYLSAITIYYTVRPREGRYARITMYMGCLLCYVLSIGSKQVGVSLPIMLVVIEILFFSEHRKRKTALVLTCGAVFFVALCSGVLIVTSQVYQDLNISVYHNLLTQSLVLLRYPVVFFYPLDVIPQYMQPLKTSFDLSIVLSMGVIFFCLGSACAAFKKHTLFSLGIFWYCIILAPSSSVIPRGNPMLIYRTYLALYGMIVLLFFVYGYCIRPQQPRIVRLFGSIFLGIYFFIALLCAFSQTSMIQDDLRLWHRIARVFPDNNIAHYNIGSIYLRNGEYDSALEYLKRSEELDPEYVKNIYNLGTVQYLKQNHSFAEDYFMKAIELDPFEYKYYVNLGNVYVFQKKYAKALECYQRYLTRFPQSAPMYNNVSFCLFAQGKLERALFFINKAIAVHEKPQYLMQRIRIYIKENDFEKAYNDIQYLFDTFGFHEDYLFLRAQCHHARDDLHSALADYEEILSHNPRHIGALNNSAVIFYTNGDVSRATELWKRILQYEPDHTASRHNLASILS